MAGHDGSERHPDLSWSATAYVYHVADNLRLWAERVVGALISGDRRICGYDPDELARARRYEELSLAGGLWSLRQSAASWVEVLPEALERDLVLEHVSRENQRAADIAGNNAHDAHHHLWDVERSIEP